MYECLFEFFYWCNLICGKLKGIFFYFGADRKKGVDLNANNFT